MFLSSISGVAKRFNPSDNLLTTSSARPLDFGDTAPDVTRVMPNILAIYPNRWETKFCPLSEIIEVGVE